MKLPELFNKVEKHQKSLRWAGGILLAVLVLLWVAVANLPSHPIGAAQPELVSNGFFSSAGFVFSVIFKLGIVILLIYVSLYTLRKWQLGKMDPTTKTMQVIETIHLTPHQSLHLVQIASREILIGATDQALTLLGEVEKQAFSPEELISPEFSSLGRPAATFNFASLLRNSLFKHSS